MIDDVMALAHERLRRRGTVDTALLARREADLRAVLAAWHLEIEAIFPEGVGFPVLAVCSDDGTRGVLKLGEEPQQARVLGAAQGRGYARLLAYDAAHAAQLTEKLGAELWSVGLTVVDQARVAARVLAAAWGGVPFETGAALETPKAEALAGIVDRLGAKHGAGHDAALAQARAWALDLSRRSRAEVVCHGDPHPGNCLQRGSGWAFVDPDGFQGERAYDLGVVMRDFSREFAAAEAYRSDAGVELLRAACRALADESGVAAERIWRWAFVERVTTGLYLGMFGFPTQAASYLDVADRLVAVSH